MRIKIFLIVIILIFVVSLSYIDFCFAGGTVEKCPPGQVCLDNPLGTGVTPQIFIGKIIKAILGIVGSLALVMFTP